MLSDSYWRWSVFLSKIFPFLFAYLGVLFCLEPNSLFKVHPPPPPFWPFFLKKGFFSYEHGRAMDMLTFQERLKQMQYLGLDEDEADLYLSQIRHDKNGKYDPNLLTKIPFRSNKYDIDIRTKENSCSISNIYKFSKVKCDIYIDKIWKFNDKYVCKWKVKNVLIV